LIRGRTSTSTSTTLAFSVGDISFGSSTS
jgi:hypothetical protein